MRYQQWESIQVGRRMLWQMPDQLLKKILAEAGNVKSVLDVGCGNGKLVFRLCARGMDAIGMDQCAEAIDSNPRLKLMRKITQENVETVELGRYDLIFCSFVLRLVDRKLTVIEKLLVHSKALVVCQTILLPGVSYDQFTRELGIWEYEWHELLSEIQAPGKLLLSEVDDFCALRQILLFKKG